MDIFVSGNYAFVASYYLGLKILDISDPANPTLFAHYDTYGYSTGVEVIDDIVYLTEIGNLMMLRFDPETGTIEEISGSPSAFALSQNYPNPFNAMTTIRYDLPEQSDVRIEIFDIMGRKIETLITETQPAGSHAVTWDGDNSPSGIYFYTITAGEYRESNSCVLLK